MAAKRPDPIDRLLAGRPGLSVTEKEDLLSRLLAETAASARPEPTRRRRIAWYAAACAACGLVFIGLLWLPPTGPDLGQDDGFTARGQAPDRPTLILACRPGQGPCREGDRLFFKAAAVAGRDHLSAFATRDDGLVIWYFPRSEGGTSVRVPPGRPGWIDQAVRLGPEHRPGRYRVTAVWTAAPIDRSKVRDLIRDWPAGQREALRTDQDLEVDAR